MNRLRRGAEHVVAAATLQEASRGAASMAAACGQCHTAVGAPLRLDDPSAVPEGDDLGSHMVRHLWAADRMWDGLMSPSDELWSAGATALADDPLFLGGPEDRGAEIDRLAREAHQIATEARRTGDTDARAELYARLITGCAGCHALAGVEWRSPEG